MQTRSYPRTLNEAFRKTAEYGCAIERPMDSQDRIFLWCCAALFVVFLLIVLLVPETK